MNLKNWFNFNYLWQNIKKSKSILLLMLTIIPIISAFIMIIKGQQNNGVFVADLSGISILTIFGLAFIPIILSISLFGFVYKKKSVDFVNSMPISRRSIFISNTIGGILIMLLFLLLNIAAMVFAVNVFTNGILPIEVIFDYIILWSVSYIFMFVLTNLAMSLSGNAITQIIVTILLIAFVPFLTDFTFVFIDMEQYNYLQLSNNKADEIEYYCYDDLECEKNKELGKYYIYLEKDNKITYNLPYSMIRNFGIYENDFVLYNNKQIIHMSILTIIYLFLGYFAFKKRKMEVCETTFKSYKEHSFIKCLTMTPFMFLLYTLIEKANINEFYWVLLFIVLLIGYYYVYDLITKKGIQNFKKSILYLLIFTIISFAYCGLISIFSVKEKTFELTDIDSVVVNFNNLQTTEIENQKIIDLLVLSSYNKDCEYINYDNCYYGNIIIKINGNSYSLGFNYTDELFNNIKNKIVSEGFENKIKKTSYDKIMAIKINNNLYDAQIHKNLINLININNSNDSIFNNMYVSLYYYQDHQIIMDNIIVGNLNVANYIGVYNNNKTCIYLNNNLSDDLNLYIDDNIGYEYDYLIDYYQDEIANYYKNKCSKVFDASKEYVTLIIWDNLNDNNYFYYDNDIDDLMEFLEELKKQALLLPEYRSYLESNKNIEVNYEYTY